MTKVEMNGKIYCVETLLYTINRLKKELLAEVELRRNILDDIKAEIEQLNPVDYGSMFSYESHNGARDMKRDVLEIIDRHIGKRSEE